MGKMVRGTPAGSTDLDRVLDTENRLAQLLAEAESEAQQQLTSARLEAEHLEQEAPLALDIAVNHLREAEAEYQEVHQRTIRDSLRTESERYRALSPADLSGLADLALQRLLESGA